MRIGQKKKRKPNPNIRKVVCKICGKKFQTSKDYILCKECGEL